VKDIKLIRRDLNNLSQVIGALITALFSSDVAAQGGEPPAGQGDAHPVATILRSAMVYGSMVIGLFVGWCMLAPWHWLPFRWKAGAIDSKTHPLARVAGSQIRWLTYLHYLGWFYLIGITLLQKPLLPPSLRLTIYSIDPGRLVWDKPGVRCTWRKPDLD
jgi:hypothetical protein